MDASLLTTLPNLSIGVIAVLAFAYTTIKNNESRENNTQNFLNTLDRMRNSHESAMKERENAFRSLEKEVRSEILSQLSKNSQIMERVINHLDKH
jgi:predicted glycoside hydrolase/deacetylase ChbG (UPF0249 family)